MIAAEAPTTWRRAEVSWEEADLETLRDRARGLSGLEFIRGMMDDRVPRPPVAQALGITVDDAGSGWVRFSLVPQAYMTNHLGIVAGGILATALDAALGCAALTTLPAEADMVTLDLSLDFLTPVRAGYGPVTFKAEVAHPGRRRVLTQGTVLDASGRVCVHGRSSCLVTAKS